MGSDQGVFLSVAARVLDGDALYRDVVDNKDPLFFFTYAGALLVGGWRGPSLLDGIWFGLAALGFAALVRALGAPRAAVVAGFAIYPLALAGGWYFTGLSMLGALAVAPWCVWLWLRGHFAAAGALAAVTLLFKLNLGLVVLGPLVVLLVADRATTSRTRQGIAAAAGGAVTLGVAALVLAAQGSLRAYLETIAYNVHYANARIDSDSPITRVRAHLSVVWQHFSAGERWQALVALAVVAAVALVCVLTIRRGERALRLLALLAATTLVAGVATAGLTAYYAHHLQLLALPAALAAVTFVTAADRWRGPRLGGTVAAACIAFAAWSAAKHDWPPTVSQWSAAPVSVGARELERARVRYFPTADRLPYVVFGTNGEDGHAAFIDGSFDLACRWFHLYRVSTTEQFEETIDCMDRQRPPLVLVTFGFYDEYPGATEWQGFVAEVRKRLAAGYERIGAAEPGFEVWHRVTAP